MTGLYVENLKVSTQEQLQLITNPAVSGYIINMKN